VTSLSRRPAAPLDRTILGVTLLLVGIGVVMVFSASSAVAAARYGDGAWYLKRHLVRVVIGLVLMVGLARARYERVARLGGPLLVAGLIALVLVLLPALGIEANGAHRWLALGPIRFQPSDPARFALLLWLAHTLAAQGENLTRFRQGLLPVLGVIALTTGLIVLEPNYSTAFVLASLSVGLVFLAGARFSHLAGLALATLPAAWAVLVSSAYRRERLLSFLSGGGDIRGSGYQVWQSLLGLGNGGLLGVGLGNSGQKLHFLPEPYNDFIFSVLGEELGFVGGVVVLVLFLVLVLRALQVAHKSPDVVGTLLATGVGLTIGLHVLVNVGVVTSTLPATGLALPFISYGGSFLVFSLAGIGLLLAVARRAAEAGNLDPGVEP
jgi:cell division protein FtsW